MQVDDSVLSVGSSPLPLPWFGKRIASEDVEQVFVQKIRNSVTGTSGWVHSYEVWILSSNGHRIQLLDVGKATGQRWGEQTKADSELIESRIEEFLDIDDSPVEKEDVTRFHGGSTGNTGSGGP